MKDIEEYESMTDAQVEADVREKLAEHVAWEVPVYMPDPRHIIIEHRTFRALVRIAHDAVHPRDQTENLLTAIFGGDDDEGAEQGEAPYSRREDTRLREYALQAALTYAGIQTANDKEVSDLAGQAEVIYHFLAGGAE